MTTGGGGSGEAVRTSAGEAFAVLGNETRLGILLALGEADGPLAFSELYEAVEYDTTANFSYHLEKLEDHFVGRAGEGYELRRPGRRVVEAVLSGAFTRSAGKPQRQGQEPEPADGDRRRSGRAPDPEDGSGAEESSWETFWERAGSGDAAREACSQDADRPGSLNLPPAGSHDRTPGEVLGAAEIWRLTEVHGTARGVCPRCSATVEHSVRVCEDHEGAEGGCDRCGRALGATVRTACTYCIFEEETSFAEYLLGKSDVMAFLIDHDVDPVAPEGFHVSALEGRVLSTGPFRARFCFTADGDELVLEVDEDLDVVDVTRRSPVENP